jgi:L-threonylcarbamoyladenylate synthase
LPFVPASLRLRTAVEVMRRGGVIACPTEAVWGLSCDPRREKAVARLLRLKHRPVAKGLILVAGTPSQLGFLLEGLPVPWLNTLAATWPGPTTWLIPHHRRVPPWIHGAHKTVAVRVSDHPVVRALCGAWGGPLVSTSANPAGARPPVVAFQVRRYFGHELDGILPGAVGGSGRPTVIRDLATGRVVRA